MGVIIAKRPADEQESALLGDYAAEHDLELRWTEAPRDATRLAAEATAAGVDRVVVFGGDGTINEAVAGLMSVAVPPLLGLLPGGTGNDFCRALGIPVDRRAATGVITAGVTRPVDLGVLDTPLERVHFTNMSAFGFAGELDQRLAAAEKQALGTLAYLKCGIEALADVTPLHGELQTANDWVSFSALNIVVANGRFAGGGIPVAPKALVDDGLLDVVIYLGEEPQEQLRNALQIYQGVHLDLDNILWLRTERVRFRLRAGAAMNYDGETFEHRPEVFEYYAEHKALRIFCRGSESFQEP